MRRLLALMVVEQEAQQSMIKAEAADPQVIYVPAYNPTVVCGAWSYPEYPPYYWPPSPIGAGQGHTHLREQIPYKKAPCEKVKLPKRQGPGSYRDPKFPFTFVKEGY